MNTALRIVALLGLVLATGCLRFPYGMSMDKHEYLSTPSLPLTIALVDTVTHEEVWRVDVPVNKKLVVDLEHTEDNQPGLNPAKPAHKISWQIMDPGALNVTLAQTKELNGNPVLLKMIVRDSPEIAGTEPLPMIRPADSSMSPGPSGPAPSMRDEAHEPIDVPADHGKTNGDTMEPMDPAGSELDVDEPAPVDVEPAVVE